MPIKFTIGKKEARFEGGQPTFNATVSGPAEIFSKPIRQFLFLHGLNSMGDGRDFEVWTSRYAVGAPMHYLGAILKKKFNASLEPGARREIELATAANVGASHMRYPGPGDQALSVTAGSQVFIANCSEGDYARRQFLSGAGWLPIQNPAAGVVTKFGSMPFATRDPFIASNLDPFMDEAARRSVGIKLAGCKANMKISQTQEPPADFAVPAPEGLDYLPFQKTGIAQVLKSGKSALIADDMGLGKAQPLDAGILTPEGWRLMGDIRVGGSVIGSDGQPTPVTGVFPQGMKEIFRVTFSDGTSTECCDEHLWAIGSRAQIREGRAPDIRALAELRSALHDASGAPRFFVPLAKAIAHPERSLPLPPYVLGASEDLVSIPVEYMTASIPQRIALLVGLLDANGSSLGENGFLFWSASRAKVEAAAALVRSLGGIAHRIGCRMVNTVPHEILSLRLPGGMLRHGVAKTAPFLHDEPPPELERAITMVESVGMKPAQCIAVAAADHLYVTDGYILTHNTIQGIGILNGRPDAKRTLVLCQANMRLKWVREIEKWKTDPDLTVGHAEGSTWPDTDVVVINYDIANRHVDRMRAVNWDLILTDEAHNLKNEEAQRTEAVLGTLLSAPSDADFIPTLPLAPGGQMVHLTGTPKPNRVSELWPLLTTSRPDIWGTGPQARMAFLNRYQPPTLIKKTITKGKRSFDKILAMPGKPIRELELQMRMRGSGSFIRRLKRDTDLPPKFRTPLPMPYRLTKEDVEMLKSVETEFADLMARAAAAEGRTIVAGERRQASEIIDVISGRSLKVDFHEIARVRANLGALKAPMAARFIIDELAAERDFAPADRRKTVVFAHHKTVIQTIAALAEEEFPRGVLVYDGSVSAKKRQDMIDRFDADPSAVLMIISLAGATGITLTASSRMRVVEPDYSPSNMVQIEDRIWRIGQMRSVDIGYLFIPDSMDANVGLSLIEKMETDERSINTMSFRGMNVTAPEPQPLRAPAPIDTNGDCAAAAQQSAFTF